MQHLFDFDAYFFDFDGLLASTEKIHFHAYKTMLARRGFTLPWDFTTYCRSAHQSTSYFAKTIYDLFPALEQQEPEWLVLREEKQRIYLNLLDQEPVDLMPGVEKFLRLLSDLKKPMYVVTNAPEEQVVKIRRHQPALNCFKSWVTREYYNHPKPSPECYLTALKIHGDPHCKGIGFEDSTKGIQALLNSPIEPVWICPQDYPRSLEPAKSLQWIYHSFDELLQQANSP
jgi:beta-phosphoglucomutase